MTKERISITVDIDILKKVDDARGKVPRSEYIETIISEYFAPSIETPATQSSALARRDVTAFAIELRDILKNIEERLDRIEKIQTNHTTHIKTHNEHHGRLWKWLHRRIK